MSSPSKRQSSRQLRERKQKKLYSEDWALGDDDDDEVDDGRHTFNLQEKLEDASFAGHNLVREMHGTELNVAHLQRYGFNTPLLFREKTGLGLRVPPASFTVNDVRSCVGSRRIVDVMDVNTQKNSEMTMRDWQKYYEQPHKSKLLNVISLEFSHTKLAEYVQSPTVVRQVDWVDNVWPRHLKESQVESTNVLEEMKYPKVQKYCLMSVKNCYTDFHVDFGGTSVWYHILKGCKVFWLIPPTEHNLALYERWVLSGKQSDIFFGDTVEKCARIRLEAGNTFFIPTGWIHAVYTPADSLVFGGNFLHSYGIEKQLKCAQVEDTTKVPQKFRYPFFTEMLWYVLEKYVYCLLGNSHLSTRDSFTLPSDRPHIHLTQAELHGLKEIVLYLHMLPANKKNVPDLIKDPISLIQDVRTLIGLHRQDNRELAITGRPVLCDQYLPKTNRHKIPHHNQHNNSDQNSSPTKAIVSPAGGGNTNNNLVNSNNSNKISPQAAPAGEKAAGGGPRRRRTRCKKCEACQRSDCGDCSFCLDMVKFGGPGRAKQTCNMRQCLQPMLPVTAACIHCGLDGWMQTPLVTPAALQKGSVNAGNTHLQRYETPSSLMECSVCYEITHPACVQRLCPDSTGYINEDMPNSWECPMCCKLGKNADYRPRHFRARQKSSDMRRMSTSSDITATAISTITTTSAIGGATLTQNSTVVNKCESKVPPDATGAIISNNPASFPDFVSENEQKDIPLKKRRSSENNHETEVGTATHNNNNKLGPNVSEVEKQQNQRKSAFRLQLAQQIAANSSKPLKRPMVVVRPAAIPNSSSPNAASPANLSNSVHSNLVMNKRCILSVFRHLSVKELVKCGQVCKTWATYSVDPSLWRKMSFNRRHISSDMLKGIVRRQPEQLHLDWCSINKFQLPWLIQRLNNLRQLSLIGINVKTAVSLKSVNNSALATLQVLDLSFVSDFNDAALRDILRPMNNDVVRLKQLHTLKLNGTDVTDIAMRYVTQYVPRLQHLSLSLCARISDAGIAQLTTRPANTVTNLISLDLSHSKLVTETSLDYLAKCERLTRLDCRHSMQISTQALIRFAAKSERDLQVRDIKLVDVRQPRSKS